jgi:hypothetical protein
MIKKDVWVPAFAGIRIPDFYQHFGGRASPARFWINTLDEA